jgi:hypothetical protein
MPDYLPFKIVALLRGVYGILAFCHIHDAIKLPSSPSAFLTTGFWQMSEVNVVQVNSFD